MNTERYSLTIIIPVFNEEDNMLALEQRFSAFLPTCRVPACVLFVNDGSKDRSGELIREVCSRHEDFFYLSFARNAGLSAAIKAGFDAAGSEFVGYIDADLQTAPEDFNLLLDAIADHSMAIGIRAKRNDSFSKRFQSRFANGFRRMMTGDDAVDTGCPLKIIRSDVAKRIPMFKGMHRFFPALVMLQEGASYVQIPIRHFPRTAGVSKFSMWNRLVGPLMDCFAYRWMKTRYINYSIAESNID